MDRTQPNPLLPRPAGGSGVQLAVSYQCCVELWGSASHPYRSWGQSAWSFPGPPTRWHQDPPWGRASNHLPAPPGAGGTFHTPYVLTHCPCRFFSPHLFPIFPSVHLNGKHKEIWTDILDFIKHRNMSPTTVSSIVRQFWGGNGKRSICVFPVCVHRRNELLMQQRHSGKLCLHRDYDTTDLGLKLEYSDLNWEMIFLSKWMVYSVWVKSPHICWYHFLFTLVIITNENTSTQVLKRNSCPQNLTSAWKYIGNDIFLYRIYKNIVRKIF